MEFRKRAVRAWSVEVLECGAWSANSNMQKGCGVRSVKQEVGVECEVRKLNSRGLRSRDSLLLGSAQVASSCWGRILIGARHTKHSFTQILWFDTCIILYMIAGLPARQLAFSMKSTIDIFAKRISDAWVLVLFHYRWVRDTERWTEEKSWK